MWEGAYWQLQPSYYRRALLGTVVEVEEERMMDDCARALLIIDKQGADTSRMETMRTEYKERR